MASDEPKNPWFVVFPRKRRGDSRPAEIQLRRKNGKNTFRVVIAGLDSIEDARAEIGGTTDRRLALARLIGADRSLANRRKRADQELEAVETAKSKYKLRSYRAAVKKHLEEQAHKAGRNWTATPRRERELEIERVYERVLKTRRKKI